MHLINFSKSFTWLCDVWININIYTSDFWFFSWWKEAMFMDQVQMKWAFSRIWGTFHEALQFFLASDFKIKCRSSYSSDFYNDEQYIFVFQLKWKDYLKSQNFVQFILYIIFKDLQLLFYSSFGIDWHVWAHSHAYSKVLWSYLDHKTKDNFSMINQKKSHFQNYIVWWCLGKDC